MQILPAVNLKRSILFPVSEYFWIDERQCRCKVSSYIPLKRAVLESSIVPVETTVICSKSMHTKTYQHVLTSIYTVIMVA